MRLHDKVSDSLPNSKSNFKPHIYWSNVAKFAFFHFLAVYALLFEVAKSTWKTLVWAYLLYLFGKI